MAGCRSSGTTGIRPSIRGGPSVSHAGVPCAKTSGRGRGDSRPPRCRREWACVRSRRSASTGFSSRSATATTPASTPSTGCAVCASVPDARAARSDERPVFRLTALLPLRSLGRARLVAVGINSVIGGGIFILPAAVAALVGPASLLAYLAAASIVAGVGLTLATLAARTDRSGGPYSYVSDAFGPFAGFQVGWLFCLARLTAMANLMNGFARYLGTLAPRGGEPPAQALLVLVCAAAVVGVNVAGIKTASGAATALAILKVAPLLLLALVGFFYLNPERFALAPVLPAVLGALGRRRRTPVVATFLFGGLAALLAIAGGYAELAAISAGTRMLIYLGCCGACLIPGAAGGAGRRIVAASTAALMVLLLGALERREILAGLAGLGCGTALYLVARRTGSPAAPRQGEGGA